MNAHSKFHVQTKLSAKGQVVIPKDVRDRLGLTEGMAFDVIERGDDIVLRRPLKKKRASIQEATARVRAIYQHKGPPVPVEKLSWSPQADDQDDQA